MNEKQAEHSLEKQQAVLQVLANECLNHLDEAMEKLHNQFVAFIAASGLPLPHVALVLQILLRETTDHAIQKYLGEE